MKYKKNENSEVKSSQKVVKSGLKTSKKGKQKEIEEIIVDQPPLVTKNIALESGAIASVVRTKIF